MPARSSPSIRERSRAALLIALAIIIGAVGWSGFVLALPVAMLFPMPWASSPSRLVAALVSAGYFLAASRGLPQGVANFYAADLWPGLLLWLAASASFVLVNAVAWTCPSGRGRPGKGRPGKRRPEEAREGRVDSDRARAVRYLAATVVMALPPFGITGWAQPITAAGVLFPGWGWWGLLATAAGLAMMTSLYWPAAAVALMSVWVWSAASWTAPSLAEGWKGVDLDLGQSLGRDTSLDRQRVLIATVLRNAGDDDRFIVLAESALGFWTPTVERLWREALRDRNLTVIAGAAVLDGDGYDNVLVAISSQAAEILYRERMPVPGSMWQPWKAWTGEGGGARAHIVANPVVELGGMRLAPLICYEQLIVWPVLQSMLSSPDIIVAAGNGWWTSGTSIVAIQEASTTAWARLFGLPLVTAFNI
ncbi:conjugal transfer protein TraB [Rhizobium sp. BT03]|uniref:conjugal transfer protein TraB n=1 Tax=Rhizobium sp. BT03 TaxID=3045156 RepID=UPI0024B3D744|nr:conjugal transfer protein TraB [Rhizobium sp. BT03]WHO77310.1 conjugal transfer protein TraB [Rhizobium sp. BT03]